MAKTNEMKKTKGKKAPKLDVRTLPRPKISSYVFDIIEISKDKQENLNFAFIINLIDDLSKRDKDFNLNILTPVRRIDIEVRHGRTENIYWGKDESKHSN